MDSSTLVNIGEQRYDRIMEQDKFYIDKTGFIKEWWESGSSVTLITRSQKLIYRLRKSSTRQNSSQKDLPQGRYGNMDLRFKERIA
ncbi:MAG: hypothetical protein K2G51_13295 [Lachnospiraceae bacterium]|nr:hypothetical protein [Lachnospiraceae bacterium]